MEITGRIFKILPAQSGIGKSGKEWKRGGFVMATEAEYSNDVALDLWGKIADMKLREGQRVKASIEVSSREHEGRWYTQAKAWKVEVLTDEATGSALPPPAPDMGNEDFDLF
jgi:hypothetical protein